MVTLNIKRISGNVYIASLTRYVEVVGSSLIKDPRYFLEQDTLTFIA